MAVPALSVDVIASASAFGAVGQGITDEYLRHHCGVDDLDDVTRLTISVRPFHLDLLGNVLDAISHHR